MATRTEDTVALLARVPTFEALGPEELSRVAEVAVPRRYEPGRVIFREGDAGDTCYVLKTGHVRVIREHADGRTITLANFGPGDIFGELAMFEDERRSATVETLDEVESIAILGSDMRRLMREHPDIAVKLVISLGRRLRAANERILQPVVPDRPEPRRDRRDAARQGGAGRGRGQPRRARLRDPGRHREAGRLLARVGEPLPRGAGARGCDRAGPGKAHRP